MKVSTNIELVGREDQEKYFLTHRGEILHVLREVIDDRDPVTAYFNDGDDFLVTILLDADERRVILDCGGNEQINRRALAAPRLVLTTTHERIKIQFASGPLKRVQFEDRPAFRISLPERVLRLQRREYFRLTAPVGNPLRCSIPLFLGAAGPDYVHARVLDISAAGLAILAPPEGDLLAVDRVFEYCRLDLPGAESIDVTLRVRNAFQITRRDGRRVRRYGCQFVGLPAKAVQAIQRYVMKRDRGSARR